MWQLPNLNRTYFHPIELAQIETLFDALVPGDVESGMPGATKVAAGNFLSQLLALGEEHYYKIPVWRVLYDEGLGHLETASLGLFKKSLELLSRAQATVLLEQLELGDLKNLPKTFEQKTFFKLLRTHCIQGCFSDPRWGGNRNAAMWRWLGWPHNNGQCHAPRDCKDNSA